MPAKHLLFPNTHLFYLSLSHPAHSALDENKYSAICPGGTIQDLLDQTTKSPSNTASLSGLILTVLDNGRPLYLVLRGQKKESSLHVL